MGSVLSRDLTLDLSSTEKENLKSGVFLFLFFLSPRGLMFSYSQLISNTCLAFGHWSLLGPSSLRTQVLDLFLVVLRSSRQSTFS